MVRPVEGVEELLREALDVVVDAVAVIRVHRPAVDVEDVAEVAEVGRFRIHQKGGGWTRNRQRRSTFRSRSQTT